MGIRTISPLRTPLAALLAAIGIALLPGDVVSTRPVVAAEPLEASCDAADVTVAGSVPSRTGNTPPPPITARNAAVIDGATGRVLLDGNMRQRVAPASTTKIMTALLAIESVPLDTWTRSATDAREMPGSSVMGLREGQYIRMEDLLYGLMLPSGNDAAIEIARHTWGTEERFVQRMNERAALLGLADTHFANPHGLDHPEHYSSAYDLAMLGRHAMGNATFRQIASTRAHRLGPPADYTVYNGNSLLDRYPGAEGVKIGWTGRARWTFVASATRDGHTLFVAVLGSEDRDGDASNLLDWAFAEHEWREVDPRLARAVRFLRAIGVAEALTRLAGVCP